ncbi:MAG: nitroreductase family protein [Proteobacteria bacterium]|nr:nitroreductase family protein [Pseudomonadota bacterium]
MKLIYKLLKLLLNQRAVKEDNETLNIILNRKSCRRFSKKKVSKEILEKILLAGASTPSTVNLQTWSFFPFDYDEWYQKFGNPIPFGAQAAIIVCADLKRLEVIDPVFKKFPYCFYTLAVMNASLSAMNMTLAIEGFGLKSIMLSQTGRTGFMDYEYIKEKLSLPSLVFPLTTIAFGFPENELLFSPPKLDKEVIIHRDGKYTLREEETIAWLKDMDFACNLAEGEKITEKFKNYLKMLPKAEEELANAFKKISD